MKPWISKKTILYLLARIRRFYQQNAAAVFCLTLCNGLTVSWSLFHNQQPQALEITFLYLLTLFLGSSLLIRLLQGLPLRRLASFLISLLVLGSLFFCFLEIFTIYQYKARIGAGILYALLQTNAKEAQEFIQMYIGLKGGLLLFAAGAIVSWIYRQRQRWQQQFRSRSSRLLLPLFFLSLCAAVRLPFAYLPLLEGDALDIPMLRVYGAARTALSDMEKYQEIASQVNDDIVLKKNDSKIKNIVFILGESTSRHYMHLYDYPLENTPNFDALKKNNELAVFTDVISPHSITTASLKVLFTFANYESDIPWYQHHTMVDVMKKAGYQTFWLSNQESSGIWGNVAQLFAHRSDHFAFTSFRDSREEFGTPDEALFPLLDQAQTTAGNKNFYVLHLMGGHGAYYYRYPYSFAKFQPEDIQRKENDERKLVLAQYTNALYYNDYIVSSVFDKFRDKEALVIYLPDHGETVYDDSGLAGHVEENPNRFMLEIPMIVWASPSFKEKYPEKWAAIRQAVDRPYMTDDIIHTILDLADIAPEEFDPTRSVVSPSFNADRLRMVQGKNYDTEIRPDKK